MRIHYGSGKIRAVFLPLIVRMMDNSSGEQTGIKSPLSAKNEKARRNDLRTLPLMLSLSVSGASAPAAGSPDRPQEQVPVLSALLLIPPYLMGW